MSNIVVPQLGESVVEARVSRWLKKEGDRVEVGEALVALDPVDRAEALYQLALAHRDAGDLVKAKSAVLRALEDAPRVEVLAAAVDEGGPTPDRVRGDHRACDKS